jgi:hypothetical protein
MAINDKGKDISSRLRTIYNYTMGVLWLGVGVFFLFHKKWGYDLKLDAILTNIFGVSAILYGLFRVYRGYKNQ